jgi:tetratricopeptide (TPR) repeat protein
MINDLVWKNYTDLGCAAYEKGNLELAEKMFEGALEEAQKLGPEDSRLATSFNNLALIYQRQGQPRKAAPLYKRALAVYDRARGASRRHLASTLDNLAELYFNQGDLIKARALYRKVLSVFEQVYGPCHEELVPRLKRLGYIYCERGRYDEALQFYNRAQDIKMMHFSGMEEPQPA